MAMGARVKRRRQEELFYAADVAQAPGHPFYKRLSETLDAAGFEGFCEERCRTFYHDRLGRPSLAPGICFRLQLIGFFEGVDWERGIAWRVADSLSLRRLLGYGLDEATPDQVTISRTRRLLDTETHQAVFWWVLERLAAVGLLKGKTIGVDATTLEANAAMRSIVRRATGDTTSIQQTLPAAGEAVAEQIATAQQVNEAGIEEVVTDKGYHRGATLVKLDEWGVRSYVSEPERGRRKWRGNRKQQEVTYASRRRVRGERGKELLRRRGEKLERPFAHQFETGGMRQLRVRGLEEVRKKLLVQATACNVALLLRTKYGAGTPEAWRRQPKGLTWRFWGSWRRYSGLRGPTSLVERRTRRLRFADETFTENPAVLGD